ncbi:DNA primase family protein [Desulfogranum marinum]|uniref:DNA primase family protein n=1 Tax=Desulfogranum marinum TaxID=453220 RepID=UPI00196353A8|nr:phage/plasmid primase, P4 family [Desulfogranum marinum]MBM9514716.1 hypothetical protein [Desulfogranum marinum]
MTLQNQERCTHNMTSTASEKSTEQQNEDFNLTDLGNANRFIEQYGDRVKYCYSSKKFIIWNGKYWEEDENATVSVLVRKVIKSLYAEAQQADDEVTRTKIARHALKSEHVNRIRAIRTLVMEDQRIGVSASDFDTNSSLLNCSNGTIDTRTGQIKAHDPKDLISKIVPVDFDPNSGCPNFKKFIHRTMADNTEMVKYLQRLFGYTLTGDTSEQCFNIFCGNGSNGKSTLLNVFGKMLSDYAKQSQPDTFLETHKGRINNDIARLKAARLVTTTEPDANQFLAEGIVKQMTGGDVITARYLHKEFFEFRPQFKIIMATNHKPNIKGKDFGMWRRVRLVPFEVTIPPHEQDRDLEEKLNAELPGILAWAVRGCLDWKKNGLGLPKVIADATNEYRQEMDVVGRFIEDCCTVGNGEKVSSQILFTLYTDWCRQQGESLKTKVAFGKELKEKEFTPYRTSTERGWVGIGLKTYLNALAA